MSEDLTTNCRKLPFCLSDKINQDMRLRGVVVIKDVKQAVKELKEENNKIMCDLLRGNIKIGEAFAKLLQSINEIFGEDLEDE